MGLATNNIGTVDLITYTGLLYITHLGNVECFNVIDHEVDEVLQAGLY